MEEMLPAYSIVLKPCTHTRLAAGYGVSAKVLRNWLQPHRQFIGPAKGYKYSLEQLLIIGEKIGWPMHPL
jgi:hypothetical protein